MRRSLMLFVVEVSLLGTLSALGQAQPVIQLPHPQVSALIGGDAKFCVLYKNVSSTTGFGPFLSFVLDQHGADGPPNCDGVTFVKAEMID